LAVAATQNAQASPELVGAFAGIRDGHRNTILRTVARAALPGFVGRVFSGSEKVESCRVHRSVGDVQERVHVLWLEMGEQAAGSRHPASAAHRS
jgi:hypothetical protein